MTRLPNVLPDAAPGIVGRSIRDALLSSGSHAVASIEATPASLSQPMPTAISPRVRLIRRGKGLRKKFRSHPRARGGQ
jgi:hypothetical protein